MKTIFTLKKMKFLNLKVQLTYLTFISFLLLFITSTSAQTVETFVTNGTANFTVPVGVSSITVECIGGGGGGGRRTTNGFSGGGGGGAYAKSVISVSAGQVFSYTVGNRGGTDGTNGTNSSFGGNIVVAEGGKGAGINIATGASGGLASNSIGDVKYNGGSGATGIASNGGGGGGGGGATGSGGNGGSPSVYSAGLGNAPGGNGGNGKNGSQGNGLNASNAGGGGGGALRTSLLTRNGGLGGYGLVRITYTIVLCAEPTVQTSAASTSVLNTTSVTLNWTNGNGTAGRIVVLKQGSAVNASPASGISYTSNATFGSGDEIGTDNFVVYNGSGNSSTINGLLPSTTYYYSIYEYNTASTCYVLTGTTGNFTTASCSPTVQPTLLKACPEYTKMYVDVTRGNGTNILIVARDGAAVNADPAYNATYSANAAYGFGTQIGSGNYVVYNGSAAGTASFVMTNVNPGVTYHFKAYEYNASPNCYNLVAPATFSSTARSAGVYTSSTTTQVSTTVAQNSLSQQIVALQVVMGGGVDAAATMNSITFNTAGSTNIANDIVQARIFYTGTNATFTNATQYGATFTSFAGNLTATDNFALAAGTNYFWVVYDLKISATISNVLDASIVNFNMTDYAGTSVKIPTITAPAGSRSIISNAPGGYCTPSAGNGYSAGYCYITNASFAGTNYPIGTAAYNNLTASPAPTVTPGMTYPFSAGYSDDVLFGAISVWIDWNQNGTFENNATENILNESYSFSNNIPALLVPATAAVGATRMRVYVRNSNYNNACATGTSGTPNLGHIIDYTIVVDGPVGVQAVSCTTPVPTVTTPIAYTQGDATSALTATGTALKWYSAVTGGTSTSAPTPSSANAGTTMYYVSQTTGGCEGPRTQIAVNVIPNSCVPPLIWEGDESSDWNTGGNWSTGVIPTAETDVTINPVSSPNVYPIISGTNGVCNNFTINSVAPLSIAASYSLVINGNVSTSVGTAIAGAGTVHMNGTAAQTLTGNVTYPILRIDNTAGVSVASGTQTITLALELKDGVFTTNNTVTLRSTSAATAYLNNFSAPFTGSLSGDITVQRYLAGGLGYRYFSSPFTLASGLNVTNLGPFITGTNGLIFDPTAINSPIGFPTCWIYNENDANAIESPIAEWGWVSATDASNPLTPMQGFALNLNGNATISLTGTPSDGIVTPISISNTASSDPDSDGYNLVGNPYPSPMSWNALRALGTNSGQFTNVIKYWSTSSQYQGNYADYNGVIGTNTGPNPDLIPLGQAFMIRRTTAGVGSFNVANSARVASSGAWFYDAEAIPNLLRLRISGGSGNDEMAVYFTGDASNAYDENQDAVKMLSGMPGIPNIFSMNNTMRLAINAMGNFVDNTEIPLGMNIMTAGNYTVLATEFESFDPTSMLYLEDRNNGVFYNLRAQNSVSFNLPTGEILGRFFLHFQLPLVINANAETCLGADGNIEIANPSGDTWNVTISNEAGVMLENSTISTSEFTSTPLAAGNYTVHVQTADNFSVTLESSVYPAPVLNAAFATSATEIATNEVVLFTCTAPNTFSTYTWLFGDGLSENGSSSVTHAYLNEGIYEAKLKVSFDNCEEIYSQLITVQRDATGILDVIQGGLSVFPNPAVDMITIKYDAKEDLQWISIFDASGRLTQTEYVSGMFSNNQLTIPVRELSNGLYFMTLKSAQSSKTIRFNIQK